MAVSCALFVAACGGSSSNTSGSSSPSQSAAASASQSQPAGPVLQTVTMSATEFSFTPSTVKLTKAGTYDFKLVNAGTTTHALEITGNGIDQKTDSVSAGSSADVKVTLKAGTYQFFCPVDGHRGLGMQGTITVTG